jgi:tetratricopeptide (TPR) repeat protein
VLLAADSAQQKRDADETVLGAALHQEEVEGNLEKAIAAYKDFLARNPSDRALAATAQFHIGLCYEKLGNAEAQKAYQQVLSTYAEQTEIASHVPPQLEMERAFPR